MNKNAKWLLMTILILALIVSSCTPTTKSSAVEQPEEAKVVEEAEAEEPAAEPLKVAALLPGQIYDKSWVQAGYEQLERAKEECGIEFVYTESVTQPEQAEVFRNYAQQGYDIVIGYGGEFHDAAASVAPDFPDIEFVLVNSLVADGENVTSSVPDYFETWYLSGVLACQMTKTNKVALLNSMELPHLKAAEIGFQMGAQTCGKEVETRTVYVGTWTDVNKAKEAAQALIDEGFDVIKHHLDTADIGLFTAAEDAGTYTIGTYRDQSDISPKSIVGSVVGGPVQMFSAACGQLTDGEVHIMTLETGADLVLSDLATEDAKAAIAKAKEDLLSGKVERPEE